MYRSRRSDVFRVAKFKGTSDMPRGGGGVFKGIVVDEEDEEQSGIASRNLRQLVRWLESTLVTRLLCRGRVCIGRTEGPVSFDGAGFAVGGVIWSLEKVRLVWVPERNVLLSEKWACLPLIYGYG